MSQQERDPVEVSAWIITLIFGGVLIFYAVFVDALPGGGWMVFGHVIARQTVETLRGLAGCLLILYLAFVLPFILPLLMENMSWGKWDE